jgi:nucleoside-diphosphate-sugar epimerase
MLTALLWGQADFIQTNVVGTFNLLESVRGYWTSLSDEDKAAFRFLHVSTDEVYGTLAARMNLFLKRNTINPIVLTPRQKQLLTICARMASHLWATCTNNQLQ